MRLNIFPFITHAHAERLRRREVAQAYDDGYMDGSRDLEKAMTHEGSTLRIRHRNPYSDNPGCRHFGTDDCERCD